MYAAATYCLVRLGSWGRRAAEGKLGGPEGAGSKKAQYKLHLVFALAMSSSAGH